MNIRKAIDYSSMYADLDELMAQELPQMKLYCEIGRIVSSRAEKGAAVAAAEYLQASYPDVSGFSPRNLRRMREFYRTYENSPTLMDEAMEIGWTQNVVIMESELTLDEIGWYIRAVRSLGWTKLELTEKISEKAHEAAAQPNGSEAEQEPGLKKATPIGFQRKVLRCINCICCLWKRIQSKRKRRISDCKEVRERCRNISPAFLITNRLVFSPS